jgi:dodecin
MAVAKVIEIIGGSKTSFEDAIKQGIERATDTINDVSSVWVKDQNVMVTGGKIVEYRVSMMVTFVLKGGKGGSAAKKK